MATTVAGSLPVTTSPADAVRQWLRKGGLPLELQVARQFGAVGADATHSLFYRDATAGKSREMDVVARFTHSDLIASVSAAYVVECKNSPKAVWVIFQSASRKDEFSSNPLHAFANNLRYHQEIDNYIGYDEGLHFSSQPRPGYQVADTEGNNQNPHSAISQALSATDGAVQWTPQTGGIPRRERQELHIFVPVVVTTASLCTVDVDSQTLDVQQVRSPQQVRVQLGADARTRSVWIVPADKMEDFAYEARRSANRLRVKNEPNEPTLPAWPAPAEGDQ